MRASTRRMSRISFSATGPACRRITGSPASSAVSQQKPPRAGDPGGASKPRRFSGTMREKRSMPACSSGRSQRSCSACAVEVLPALAAPFRRTITRRRIRQLTYCAPRRHCLHLRGFSSPGGDTMSGAATWINNNIVQPIVAVLPSPYKYGGSGDDTLYGYMPANWLYGNGGNDTLIAYGATNTVDGGSGND